MNKLNSYLLKVFLSKAHTLVVESRFPEVVTARIRIWIHRVLSEPPRKWGQEELLHIRGKEQWLHFAGPAVKRYPTSKVRETQVRQQVLRGGTRGQTDWRQNRRQLANLFARTTAAAAAAAAKSLQSCPTLCSPIDGSPLGSSVPGILQARTLEWVAISFSNAWKWKVKVKLLRRPLTADIFRAWFKPFLHSSHFFLPQVIPHFYSFEL